MQKTQLNPHLSFRDNARQAMEFYQSVFGGNLDVHLFSEFNVSPDPAEANKIMHAQLQSDTITLMAADTPNSMEYQPGSTIALSLSGEDEATLKTYFEKLSEGGKVTMPLAKAQWGDWFGMCIDKFGMSWMVNIGTTK